MYHKSFTKASKVVSTIAIVSVYTFFYKNNFIRTKALILAHKNEEQAKNKDRLAVPQNIRTKCLG